MEDLLLTQGQIIELCGGLEEYQKYNHLQVREIINGYINGLRKDEILRYSDPQLSVIEMSNKKKKLLQEAEPNCMLKELRNYLSLVDYYYDKMCIKDFYLSELYILLNSEIIKYKKYGYNKNSQLNIRIESEYDVLNNLYALAYAGYLYNEEQLKEVGNLSSYLYKMKKIEKR